jgi:hypothetical protein
MGGWQALNAITRERAEWILWLDMDMVLENITFSLPLEQYAGKDLVLWGQPEWIMKGHNAKGALTAPDMMCTKGACPFVTHAEAVLTSLTAFLTAALPLLFR